MLWISSSRLRLFARLSSAQYLVWMGITYVHALSHVPFLACFILHCCTYCRAVRLHQCQRLSGSGLQRRCRSGMPWAHLPGAWPVVPWHTKNANFLAPYPRPLLPTFLPLKPSPWRPWVTLKIWRRSLQLFTSYGQTDRHTNEQLYRYRRFAFAVGHHFHFTVYRH